MAGSDGFFGVASRFPGKGSPFAGGVPGGVPAGLLCGVVGGVGAAGGFV